MGAIPPYQDLHAIGACPVRPYSALQTDFSLEVRVTGGAVRTSLASITG